MKVKWLMLVVLLLGGCSAVQPKESIKSTSVQVAPVQKEIPPLKEEQPIVKKRIVIDPGHSSVGNPKQEPIGPGSKKMKAKDVIGATGISTKTPEYKIVLGVGVELQKLLLEQGFEVSMTKTTVEQSLSNIERAEFANKQQADLMIRLHCDSNPSSAIHGASMLVPKENQWTASFAESSKKYGEIILPIYCQETGLANRGVVYRDDLTGFNWSKVPTVLIEMGFLSNPKEDQFLSNEQHFSTLAQAIAKGVAQIEFE